MHDQTTPQAAEPMDLADQDLLTTLTDEDSHRPCSLDELAREYGAARTNRSAGCNAPAWSIAWATTSGPHERPFAPAS
jgi:hypothetical protein